MKLTDIILKKAMLPNLKGRDRKTAITELAQALRKASEGEKFSVSEIVDAIIQREKLGTTGVGGGVAIPHAKVPGLKNVIGAFGRSSSGLDFTAVDGEAVHLVFLILSPPAQMEAYARALQKIMTTIKNPNFGKFLRSAKTLKDIEEIFKDAEEVAPV